VSTDWKPTRRERLGEFLEGLSGFTKSVACVERNAQELGRPDLFLPHCEQVGEPKQQVGKPKTIGGQISP
jgi:hypothetical protein